MTSSRKTGQRLAKQTGDIKTSYVYSGLTLLSLTQEGPTVTQSLTYLYGFASTPVAARYSSTESTTSVDFALIADAHGDVRELRDMAGAVFTRYSYDAYGNITSEKTFATSLISLDLAQKISALQPLRYAGYVFDVETGLYYCSQRYYDPATASFISKDPAKADGEQSAYGYCTGEPVGGVDPSGLIFTSTYDPYYYESAATYEWIYEAGKDTLARLKQAADSWALRHESNPTYNGSTTNHVWKDAPAPYYRCSCCGKYFTRDGVEIKSANTAETRAAAVFISFKSNGWSDNAIAAAMGNIAVETDYSFDPATLQKNQDGSRGPGYGLIQWDYTKPKMLQWMSENGYANDSLGGQAKCIQYQMFDGGTYWNDVNNQGYFMPASSFIKSDGSLDYLTQVFLWSLEKPSYAQTDARIEQAKTWQDYFNR